MSRLEELRSLRDLLRESISEVEAHFRAPLANQYRATLLEIESLESSAEKAGDPIDELAARRAARAGVASKASRRATRGGK